MRGMNCRALAFAIVLVLGGCAARHDRTLPAAETAGTARFLALGDSYTIGEGVASADRWPEILAGRLATSGVAIGQPEVIARTGWTTGELSDGIDAAEPRGPYALVTLMIGVNNQYRGRPVDEYRRDLDALVTRSIAFAGGRPGRVIVMSIPDWGATPFASGRDRAAISAEIDRFNAVAHAAAEHSGTRWADVTQVSRRAGHEPALVAGDGLHPSRAMHVAWTDVVLPEARAALAGP